MAQAEGSAAVAQAKAEVKASRDSERSGGASTSRQGKRGNGAGERRAKGERAGGGRVLQSEPSRRAHNL